MAEYYNEKPITSYSGKVKEVNGEKVLVSLKGDLKLKGLERSIEGDIEFSVAQIESVSNIENNAEVRVDVFRSEKGTQPKERIYIISH